MKKFLCVITSLYGASISAGEVGVTCAQKFNELLALPQGEYSKPVKDFIQFVSNESLDIDTVSYKGETIGDYLNDLRHVEPALTQLRKTIEPYRSNPYSVAEFFVQMERASTIHRLTDCEKFLSDKMLNVDRITTFLGETLAGFLEKTPEGKAILQLPAIRSYRDDVLNFKKDFEWALDDGKTVSLGLSFESLNVKSLDDLLYSPGKTMREYLLSQLGSRPGALRVAKRLSNKPSEREELLRRLYTMWQGAKKDHKQRALELLKEAFEAFPLDVDIVTYQPEKPGTIGDMITQQLNESNKRANALALARLVQTGRSDRVEVLRTLLRIFEKDRSVLEQIKGWVAQFPVSDLTGSLYDAPASKSMRAKIDEINDMQLTALFKQTAPTKGKGASKDSQNISPQLRVSGKKLAGLALVAAAGLGYYLHYTAKNNNTQNEQSVSQA